MKLTLYKNKIISPDGEEYSAFNVVPEIGIDHDHTPDCWCHPRTEFHPDNKIIVIRHEVMQ